VSAGVLFPDAPRFRDQAVAEGRAHRCALTEGLAQALFDDDGREWGTPLEFEPLYRPFDIDAAIADWSDADCVRNGPNMRGSGARPVAMGHCAHRACDQSGNAAARTAARMSRICPMPAKLALMRQISPADFGSGLQFQMIVSVGFWAAAR
jgi:hypothetical protein